MTPQDVLRRLGIEATNSGVYAGEWLTATGAEVEVPNPTTGETLARVTMASGEDYEKVVASSVDAFEVWRRLPAPKRGEYVRRLGNALREDIDALGALVTLEMGKFPRASGRCRR
jgi:aldehyde dehydrogenase (NAD+)